MKKVILLILIFSSFGIIYLIKIDFDKFKILEKGQKIEVTITDIPVTCKVSNKSLKAYFKFSYKEKEYSKNLKDKYCSTIKTGDKLNLITNKEETIFLYPDENVNRNLISLTFLFLVLTLCCFIIIRRPKN